MKWVTTPQLLRASPRTVSRDHHASPVGKVALKPVTLKVGLSHARATGFPPLYRAWVALDTCARFPS